GVLSPLLSRDPGALAELHRELAAGSQRGSALPRAILADLGTGPRSLAEQRARHIVVAAGLPQPQWHVLLHDEQGRRLCRVGAWWQRAGLAWIFGADDTPAPGEHSGLAAHHVVVLRTPETVLRADPATVGRRLTAAYVRASQTPPPQVWAG
ncbi:MAG: hypothetical protein ACRDP4_03410, partial [Nocardioidaceae bacterium]